MKRVDHKGNGTSNRVIDNLRLLNAKYSKHNYVGEDRIYTSVKATLPLDMINHMSDSWDDFYELHQEFENISVGYSPTIDYVNRTSIDNEVLLSDFKSQIKEIAKKELNFYAKNGRHLMSWFGNGDGRSVCTAGYSMASIDVNGDLHVCHGTMYDTKGKKLLNDINSHHNIFEDDIEVWFEKMTSFFKNPKVPDECHDCVATHCTVCPVMNNVNSDKETVKERWVDNNNKHSNCDLLKEFGRFDRAIQEIIKRDKL
jgi:radical SAM protein with 4Fe4S-binding SPASM domain